jgi:6-methylsalicylate decarboxylase
MNASPHRIDTHHHVLPDFYVEHAKQSGLPDAGGVAFPSWSVQGALSLMDRCGIATAVTSISAPGVHFGNAVKARALARRCNEFSARMISDHPGRFGAFAVLPLPDVDGALDELAYAFDTLHLDGIVMLASYGDHYLGAPAFDAVFDELQRRKSVVFVHPTIPATSQALTLALPAALVEFVFDTTRAATNLIYSGTLERCPDVSIILSHAGGTIPYVAGRLTLGATVPVLAEKAPKGAIAYLKRFYYDTALSANAYALHSLRELVDPSHILFGSDTPFLPEQLLHASIQGLADYFGFEPATRKAVERDNGLALFPRLQRVHERAIAA